MICSNKYKVVKLWSTCGEFGWEDKGTAWRSARLVETLLMAAYRLEGK